MNNKLHVVGMQVENVQKIKFAEISPDQNTVIISGSNGAGKSSLCNALKLALGDKAAAKLITRPITEGEHHAMASVDLGKFRITRTWNDTGKSSVKIESTEGAVYKSPAEMLKNMVGNLAFDPLEFSQMTEKEQVAVLLNLINLPINLDDLAEQRDDAYGTRTLINRTILRLQGQLEGHPYPGRDIPDQEISTSAVMAEFQAASKQLTKNNELRATHRQILNMSATLENDITRLERELSEKKAQLSDQNAMSESLQTDIDKLVDPDLSTYQTQLETVEETNKRVRNKQERNKLQADIEKEKARSQELTNQIQAIDDLKARTIAETVMPIDGLGFNETGVLFNGIPLKQCSTSESLKVGCAIVIATMKQQPGDCVAVIIIKDGSLLDANNLATLEEIAVREGVQFWIEVVDTTGERGIYIEDGEIKHPSQDIAQHSTDANLVQGVV